jgi:hypothetical protein
MANQYSAEKKTLGELLSLTSPNIEVPEWQRNYSWETSEVETFWQDLVNFSDQYPDDNITDQEYFLGSIVMVLSGSTHELLDGQQRLATATILLSVIADALLDYRQDAATRLIQKYITDYDDATGENAYKLTLNRYDRTFFRAEIQDRREGGGEPTPELQSHRLIRAARLFFQQRLRQLGEEAGEGKPAFDAALRVSRVLTDHMSVVAVSSQDADNAATVFETLNDRGIGLSTPDLLRNLILRRATDDDSRERIIDYWQTVLEIEEEAKVDEFLRHYWLSQRGDVKTRSLYREMKATITDEETDSLQFSEDLAETALVYRDLVAARENDGEQRRMLEAVSMLGAKALMPALLSAYAVGNEGQKRRLTQALIALFVRHNLIGSRESTVLERTVYTVARDLRANGDFDAAVESLRALAPDDHEFQERFKRASVPRRASARYLLREIEHQKRVTQEVAVEAPDRVHVEHIYSLTPAGERWASHEAWVNRLGNQTLLAGRLNTSIRNSDFETKKREAYCQSDILMTKELCDLDSWNSEAVEKRQAELSEHVVEIWKFP